MKAQFKVVDVHGQITQRESGAVKGASVDITVTQFVCAGISVGTTPTTQFQLGIQSEDPNIALALGDQFEMELDITKSLLGVVK